MSNRAAVSKSDAPWRTKSVALRMLARMQTRRGQAQVAPPESAGSSTSATPTANPNAIGMMNPTISVFFENSIILLTNELTKDREERAMRCHSRARDKQAQEVYSGGHGREQGQAPIEELHEEGGQDDVPDLSIRDVGHNIKRYGEPSASKDKHPNARKHAGLRGKGTHASLP